MASVAFLPIVMLRVFMLNVVMLNAFMLIVVAPFNSFIGNQLPEFHSTHSSSAFFNLALTWAASTLA
jgi:hypothetical protein